MSFKFLAVIVCICCVFSCVSRQTPETPVAKVARGADSVVPESITPSTFSQTIDQSLDGLQDEERRDRLMDEGKKFLEDRRKFGHNGAMIKRCAADQDHVFCRAYQFKNQRGDRSREARPRKVAARILQKKIKDKNYEDLKDVDLQSLLAATDKMKFDQVREAARVAAEEPLCLPENLYVALGTAVEFDFPNEDSVNLNAKLLARNHKCYSSDLTSRLSFRLGVFKVWRNQCEEALPLFDMPLSNQNTKSLHARSTYWREWCKSKAAIEKPDEKADEQTFKITADFYKSFPQSFHSLITDDGTPALNLLSNLSDPTVRFRSLTNPDLNHFLDTVDVFIKLNENDIAFQLLEGLRPEKYASESPELLLYMSVVCHRVQAELLKFQVLGRMFEKNSAFRTLATMKLYYPSWYMDIVAEHKEKVNPHLILALIRQESAFNRKAHSPAGARGLMQLLPGTGRMFGRVHKRDLFDPRKNVSAGVSFFSYLMKKYNNQVPLALAAYNAGPKAVDEWVRRYPTDNPLIFIDIIPYRETREYVSTIMRNWYWYNQLYGDKAYPAQSKVPDARPSNPRQASSP